MEFCANFEIMIEMINADLALIPHQRQKMKRRAADGLDCMECILCDVKFSIPMSRWRDKSKYLI